MRKNDLQSLITLLDVFEVITITDDDENEYVVLKSCGVTSIDNVDDKTAFEAVMNHTHIIDDVKKSKKSKRLPLYCRCDQNRAGLSKEIGGV